MKNDVLRKSVQKILGSLKSDRNNGYFTWRPIYIFDHISVLLKWEMFQANVLEESKPRFMWITSPPPTLRRKSSRLWDTVKKCGRAGQAMGDNIIWHMRVACWITKATNTLRVCNTYCFSTATIVARTHLNVTLYVHCMYCLILQMCTNMNIAAPNIIIWVYWHMALIQIRYFPFSSNDLPIYVINSCFSWAVFLYTELAGYHNTH